MSNQIRPIIAPPTTPRPAKSTLQDEESHVISGKTIFTANDTGGTTTTLVGDNADPETETNVVRLTDRFKLFNSSDELKEDTVFHVTEIAVNGETTVTFAPAAAVATEEDDYIRLVGSWPQSVADLDARLTELGVSSDQLSNMTQNDKQFALRRMDDVGTYG